MKLFKMIVALVLALAIAFVMPLQSMAAGGKYVSEVYVAYGKDAEEAKKTLQDKGFTPVEGNLNENGNTYVMMGYKTTDNIRDSITDIAVMNMDGNFNTTEYTEVLRQRKTQVADLLNDFMATIKEYRANYKAGKAKAVAVHDLLNHLKDDDSGKQLGDLFNSETLQDKVGVARSITDNYSSEWPNLVTILMQGNALYIRTIETLLTIAADTNDNTWIDRFAEKDFDDMLDELENRRPDLNTPSKRTQFLDAEYGSLATDLSKSVAELRQELLNYEALGISVTDIDEAAIKAEFGDAKQADEKKRDEIVSDELNWMETGILYEALKNYEGGNFAKGELLDFFLEEVDEDDTERYYPMAASFSDGQRGGMDFVSFRELLRYAFLDFDSWKNDVEKKMDFSGLDSSVYSGIDRGMFKTDGSIAYTDAATRAGNISGMRDEGMSDRTLTICVLWGATAFAGILLGLSKIATKLANENMIEDFLNIVADQAEKEEILAYKGMQTQYIKDYCYDPLCGEYSMMTSVVTALKYVTIFLAIASAVYTVYTLVTAEDVKLMPIPKFFVDNKTTEDGESYQLNYKAVECNRADYNQNEKQTGNSADLNADEGKQWLAIYVSKNSMAGKPVTPDFKITETASAPSGMNGNIHMLGEKGAENLCNANYMNYSKLYSGYKSVKDAIYGEEKAYMFFKLSDLSKTYDESAGNMTASSIGNGKAALFGFGGIAIGAVLGALGAVLIGKNKKKKEAI